MTGEADGDHEVARMSRSDADFNSPRLAGSPAEHHVPDWSAHHHSLRQPLHAIGLFCAALRSAGVPPHAQGLVDGIAASASAMETALASLFAELTALDRPRAAQAESGATVVRTPGPDAQAAAGESQGAPASGSGSGLDLADGPLRNACPRATSATQGTSSTGHPAAARPPRVVIVDDDPAARQSLKMLLDAWGAEVLAFGGLDALADWVNSRPGPLPDLCVVDYHLGRAGQGPAALTMLRRAWVDQRLRMVMMTGDVRAAQAVRQSEPGLQVLIKPVAPATLIDLIEQAAGSLPPSGDPLAVTDSSPQTTGRRGAQQL